MIQKQNLEDLYPLSPMQEGMLFHTLCDAGSTAYFQQLSFRLTDGLDVDAFETAWNEIFLRHQILRTVFVHENVSRPLQAVLRVAPPRIRRIDLLHLDQSAREKHIEEWKLADRLSGFPLDRQPPVRIALFQLSERVYEVVLSHHHILMDGWCLGIVHREFLEIYQATAAGRSHRLPPASPYSAYIQWLEAREKNAAREFWREYLAGYEQMAVLPRLTAGPKSGVYRLAECEMELDDRTAALLRHGAAQARVTASTLFHMAWGILLAKYNDVQDAVFGSVIANRPEEVAGVEHMLGLFINTVPVRVKWDSQTTVRELLGTVQNHLLRRRDHEFLPLAEIQSVSELRGELFDHLVLVQNYPVARELATASGGGPQVSSLDLFEHTQYPLTVSFFATGKPCVKFSYDAEVFFEEQVLALRARFLDLLRRLLEDGEARVAAIGLAAEAPSVTWETPAERSYVELFDQAVARYPQRVALACENRQLTYAELSRLSDEVAGELGELQPDDRIGLMLPRSERLVIGMLGILKSGAAYVPIDPAWPEERREYIIRDSQCRAVLTGWTGRPGIRRPIAPNSLMYVAYTSGSTGRPKGVMIEHRNVAAFCRNLPETFGLTTDDCILGLTTTTFDISVLELLCSLAHGLRVVIATDEAAADPTMVLDLIAGQSVTVLQVTPSRLSTLLEARGWSALAGLRVLLVGGEPMPADLFEGLRRQTAIRTFNVYGPTETTIWSTALELGSGPLTVGLPLPSESVLILSREGHVTPDGVMGEVSIAGTGVGRGYWNRPDLTADRFIAHPSLPGQRLYRTGDVGRRRLDGQVEVLGRRDHQVKIRGFRVELGEIETALLAHPDVRQALVQSAAGELVAYVVMDGEALVSGLRVALAKSLPGYMIPTHIVRLDRFPLLASGKVDRRALPAPSQEAATRAAAPPRDDTEKRLAAIWEAVLGHRNIGIFDNFFDIGGHSLKATQVLGRIHKEINTEISLRELLNAPTVAELASLLRGKTPMGYRQIDPIPAADSYELSHAQRRMWILERMAAGPSPYVMPVALEFEGALHVEAFRRSLDALLERHEALRTVFPLVGEEPRQVVLPASRIELETADASLANASMEDFLARRFDLEHGPVVRACLRRLGHHRHLFLFAAHHIVSDGWSLAVLTRDLMRVYAAFAAGEPSPLRPLRIQYRDYARWQNRLLSDPQAAGASYWHAKLAGELGALNLPLDYPRPKVSDSSGERQSFTLSLAESTGLRRLSRERGASLFMVLVAVVKTLLHRYSGATDILVGAPVAGRVHPDLKDQVGVYVNTLVLRDTVGDGDTFLDVLDRVKQTAIEAFDHQSYPFDRLVDELGVPRDTNRSPIFDVMVALDLPAEEPFRLGSVRIKGVPLVSKLSRFDLTFAFAELEEGLVGLEIEYRTSLFKPSRITRMKAHLSRVIAAAVSAPGCTIADINLVDGDEAALLRAFNETSAPFPSDQSLIDLFDRQVERSPHRVAVVSQDAELTYRELQAAAERLAAHLAGAHGLGPGARVGLLLERGVPAVTAILGVLRTGGAYVPLDPGHPDRRLQELIADSGCSAVLAIGAGVSRARTLAGTPVADVSDVPPGIPLVPRPAPTDIAYVIFTSGTTGRPKGVMIEHRAVVNLATWMDRVLYAGVGDGVREGVMASLIFDVSIHELFGGLLRGNTLYMIGDSIKRDPVLLGEYLLRHQIQILSTTPSLLAATMDAGVSSAGWALRHLCIGAETLPQALIDRFRNWYVPSLPRLCNLYGPTECCVEATFQNIEEGDAELSVPIGRPIANTRVYVCDARLRPAPIGIPGEICIGGEGLARGYLNRDDLTQQAFAAALFDPAGRVYRTGDLGCWRENGTLQFLGRRDQQVKVRGYRIELGEIEHHLAALPGVREAVVLARDTADGKELVAYLVGIQPLDPSALRAALASLLPHYMVPAHFVHLAELPVNTSGKLDRKALPDPSSPARKPQSPGDAVEASLLDIWRTVLCRDGFGVEDNFFEIGGHSLTAVRVTGRIRQQLGIEVALSEIFTSPTIRQLAAIVRRRQPQTLATIQPAATAGHYPVSRGQRRLWVLSQMEGVSTAYHITAAFHLDGELDRAALAFAFGKLVQRHESLRTTFLLIDGEPRQKVHASLPPEIIYDDGSSLNRPFDLAQGPLLRVHIRQVDGTRHLLSLALHHIIADGWSLDILLREVALLYQGVDLPPLRLQAKDLASAEGELSANDRDYWLAKLAGEIPALDLPTDFPRPAVKTYRGRAVAYCLPEPIAQGLEKLGRRHDSRLYAVLVAMVKVLLHRYTGQEDMIVGSAVAGRARPELEDQIGFYAQTVALRDQVRHNQPFSALLEQVNVTIGETLDHAAYSFDRLVEDLDLPRDTSRSALFDVAVLYGKHDPIPVGLRGVQVSRAEVEQDVSKFDLAFHFARGAEGIDAAIEYNRDLFTADRIARMVGHVQTLAASLLEGSTNILSDEEAAKLREFSRGPRAHLPAHTIADQWAVQVSETPQLPALVDGDSVLSYRELDRQAETVARQLRERSALQPGEAVAIYMERCPTSIAAMIGVWKAGGVYLPIDPAFPEARAEQMIEESGCRIVIRSNGEIVTAPGAPKPYPGGAYMIFTSGSTGKPKAVLLPHRGFVNMALRQIEILGVRQDDRVLQFASPCFDASLSEMFMALFSGAALVLIDRHTIAGGQAFLDFLTRHRISVLTLPPAYLSALGRAPMPGVRVLLTAGEPPEPADAAFYSNRLRYFNAYGPTEASVCATMHEVKARQATYSIGRPLANTTAYVLDSNLDPAPIGVPGEICLAGPGLALGYINDPGLSALCFPTLPETGERIYRTGDRGWWTTGGELIFAGRLDAQVKVRGHRIEPGEVERALESCTGVRRAVVLAVGETAADRALAAYLERSTNSASTAAVREELAGKLPAFLIPAYFVWLDSFPLTVSGKIDRKALPAPGASSAAADDRPRTALETELAAAWQHVLRRSSIGIHDTFFESGGDSIKILQLAAELQSRSIRIEIADLYRYPTIAALAPHVHTSTLAIAQGPVTGVAPLSSTQAWFFRNFRGNRNHFNQSVLLPARERLSAGELRRALHQLAAHHDALRIRFRTEGPAIWQEFQDRLPEDILQLVQLDGEEEMEFHANRLHRSLDLRAGRLLAAALFRGPRCDYLFLTIHHLVVDGVSWRILLEDLETLLRNRPLPPKTHSWKEWTEQQHYCAQRPKLLHELSYWRDVVSNAKAAPAAERRATHFVVPPGETQLLLAMGGRLEGSLLTALARALHAWDGREEALITLEGHGREQIVEGIDVSRTVGWFTSMYPLRISRHAEPELASIPNRGVGYGMLACLAEHGLTAPGGIVFNYLGQTDYASDSRIFGEQTYSLGDPVDPHAACLFDVEIMARVTGGALQFDVSHPALAEHLAQAVSEAAHAAPPSASRTAAVRPYGGACRPASVPLLLNQDRPRKLFAMPPLFGYGAAFAGMAAALPACAFYAFDFIEDGDAISQYARQILAIQPEGPYALLGYSGGGNLAFEVAKEMERRGHPVADLILLDAPLRRQSITMTDDEIHKMAEGNLGGHTRQAERHPLSPGVVYRRDRRPTPGQRESFEEPEGR